MKNKHFIFLMLALAVTGFVTCLYGYMYHMIDLSLGRTMKSRLAVSAITLDRNREQSFLQAYKETATKWSSLQNFFINPGHIVDFIEAVESLSQESGSKVTLSSIDADNMDGAPIGKEGSLRAHLTAQGSWSSVMRALSLVETMPYKAEVSNVHANVSNDSLGVDLVKDKPKEQNWNMSFDLRVAMIVSGTASTTATTTK
jgi:hypothetical protein